ncbi:MAG: NepR family anti-sigma factor [Pseudomonadota bacterium]
MTQNRPKSSIESEIDDNLKRAFDEIAAAPVPSRFTDLLDQLKQGGANPANSDKGERSDND